ncbi:DUF4179 domain-containing protein [Clostridium gasigenes]|uniref:DUF4179 domain-containing protein n=1 Tax=Clostridium gasigenes TaxID=94869 RepID=UPI001C0E862F|nr:DUF4179 domain-containing protein [Clostridium gasigenes]MBU3088441.1 DUF4179 domain-containing protein [Clostridium gasigenes]
MKDIYELLNEANIDVTEIDINKIEEMEVSELERKRGKKKLMASIKTKKRTSKKIAMVASLVIIIGMSSIVIAKPAWAMDIPIIGDLIQNNLINNNSKYKDYIQAVGQTKSDQGIDITFESAVADNNVLNLSFVVKNNNESIKDNLTDALLIPTSLKVNGKSVSTGAGASWEVIDENTVRILKSIKWDYDKLPNKLNIDIEIAELFGKTGNWDVSFALNATEINKDTYVEKLDKVINVKGVDFNLTKLVITPLTTKLECFSKYTGGDLDQLEFIIIDGDGKDVKWNGGKSSSDMEGERFEASTNYINNPNTKTLNIIPWYEKYGKILPNDYEKKLPPTKINIENLSPINLNVNEDISIDINDFIVDGEFLIVKHSYKYLDTVIVRGRFSNIYINADGEEVLNERNYNEADKKKLSELYRKYQSSNNNIDVVKIGNSKNIEIGCYDGTSKVYLKDEAFTVTKK